MTNNLKRFRSYRYLRSHSKVDKATKERTLLDIEFERARMRYLRLHACDLVDKR